LELGSWRAKEDVKLEHAKRRGGKAFATLVGCCFCGGAGLRKRRGDGGFILGQRGETDGLVDWRELSIGRSHG